MIISGKCWKTEFKEYDELIDRLGIRERVILRLGYVENELAPYYFKAADVVLLPYRKIFSSGVLLRALHYGSVIVASDLPPFSKVIGDSLCGRLFRSEDADDMAETLVTLLNSQQEMDRIRHNAQDLLKTTYSWDLIGREMKGVYQRVLTL